MFVTRPNKNTDWLVCILTTGYCRATGAHLRFSFLLHSRVVGANFVLFVEFLTVVTVLTSYTHFQDHALASAYEGENQ